MKIANLILAYKDPEMVERLVKTLITHEDFHCFIHVDKKADISDYHHLELLQGVMLIKKRIAVNWAGFSCVEAAMNSLEEIFASEEKYDFVNLLSGQDYPIKSPQQIHHFLSANIGKSFISFEAEPSAWWDHAVLRFTKYHFTDFSFKGRTRLERLMNRTLPDRKFLVSYSLYGGPRTSYWTLSIEAAKYVHDFLKGNKKLLQFCRYTWAPDEFLIPTILMNSYFNETVVNCNTRYIDWSMGGPRPRVLTTQDFCSLKKSPQLFARKFDQHEDANILDLIDTELLKNEGGDLRSLLWAENNLQRRVKNF